MMRLLALVAFLSLASVAIATNTPNAMERWLSRTPSPTQTATRTPTAVSTPTPG